MTLLYGAYTGLAFVAAMFSLVLLVRSESLVASLFFLIGFVASLYALFTLVGAIYA